MSKRISARKRTTVWSNGKQKCVYCKRSIDLQEATVDHVVPLSRGGSNRVKNMRNACKWCNMSKGNLSEKAFCSVIAIAPKQWRKFSERFADLDPARSEGGSDG